MKGVYKNCLERTIELKKFHRTSQGSNFLGGSFNNALSPVRKKKQYQLCHVEHINDLETKTAPTMKLQCIFLKIDDQNKLKQCGWNMHLTVATFSFRIMTSQEFSAIKDNIEAFRFSWVCIFSVAFSAFRSRKKFKYYFFFLYSFYSFIFYFS